MGFHDTTFEKFADGTKLITEPCDPSKKSKLIKGAPEKHRRRQNIEGNFRMFLASNHLEAPDAVAIFNALHEDGNGESIPCKIKKNKARQVFNALKEMGWKPPGW